MAVVRRTIACPRAEVFATLVTPETFPEWLVGAREIRDVDDGWPAVGTAFHHRVGLIGPLTVADLSKVVEIEEPRLLSLEVRARPLGRGRVTFTLIDQPGPEGPQTVVEVDEVPIGLLAPTRPLADPLIAHRNRQSLANLAEFLGRDQPRPARG